MKLSRFIGRRIRETPKDAQTASHIFLIRGGYIRQVSAGIYSLLPLARRITSRICDIIRAEMNAIDGQEVLMPVVLPSELWQESGRYDSVGQELLRFIDRNDKNMLLGMTHEEAVVHLIRTEISSYKQLPCMVYQIQTKYRDEARPRAGLIRVREFTMKDAYSFHASQACLDQYYSQVHDAYERIFARTGLTGTLPIESDSGMMGGSTAHEFMAIAPCGEDTIFVSPDRHSYRANRDIARADYSGPIETMHDLEKVHTPAKKTIQEVADHLGVTPTKTGKAVFYVTVNEEIIFVLIRGDLDVNETKLMNHLEVADLQPATHEQIESVGAVPGFASPLALDMENVRLIVDPSVEQNSNLVVGANEEDYHYRNFNLFRDIGAAATDMEIIDVATVRAGDPCPVTGEPLEMLRGIEVGNIFQLGTKYTTPMSGTFLDQSGKSQDMIMGCYGIGVGRLMAAIIEQSHDDYGPIWPEAVSPFDIHLCALNPNKSHVAETAEKLYCELRSSGFDVVFDDRGEKAGFQFSDADLIGVPHRLVLSPKTLSQSSVEYRRRHSRDTQLISLDQIIVFMREACTPAK